MKLPCRDKLLTLICIGFIGLVTHTGQAQAQTITENQVLSFGQVVLVDNAASRQIALLPGGGFTADPQYIFFSNPQLGNITVDGYPPATPLTVTVGTTNLNPLGGGSTNFSIGSTFTDPAVVVTDGNRISHL